MFCLNNVPFRLELAILSRDMQAC